jgi:hypothetical protein
MDARTAQYQVHTGFWTNWSRGTVYGPTLTLSRSDADIFIAFIAFFVAWGGFSRMKVAVSNNTDVR